MQVSQFRKHYTLHLNVGIEKFNCSILFPIYRNNLTFVKFKHIVMWRLLRIYNKRVKEQLKLKYKKINLDSSALFPS